MFFFVFEEANLRVRVVSSSCGSSVWPQQASVLACVVLAGTREGLVSSRVLV